jgi:hypothetical protein
MTDQLPQTFNDFARGVISPETFEHELLSLCKATPDRAWEALALLDQHFRRGKIAPELQHSLRHRIERQALGIEIYQPERAPAARVAADADADADAEDPTIETIETSVAVEANPLPAPPQADTPARVAARNFRISPALALTAVMLIVAASPTVKDGQEHRLAIQAGTAAAGEAVATGTQSSPIASAGQPERDSQSLSLSSDRYIVNPGSEVAELLVERSPDVAGDTSFLWWTEAAGARPDEDYVAGKPRRVRMADGIGSSTLRIPILANPKRRHVEMFYVLIGRPDGNTGIGPIHRATVFLLPAPER